MAVFKEVNERSKAKVDDFSDELLHEFAYSALGNLCPVQAFIGGVAAQEVMKVTINYTRRKAMENLKDLFFLHFVLVVCYW